MALTNAEKQRRWRNRRNDRASALDGTPKEIADNLLRELGADVARKVARALDKRLRNLRPDCEACGGTGFMKPMEVSTACGIPLGLTMTPPCDCGAIAK